MNQPAPTAEPDFEIMRSMFAATIHNIGNILTVASLAVNDLEESATSQSPPVIDMILNEMLPTLEGQVQQGNAHEFLANDPQGREYLTAIRELLEYQRKTILQQRVMIESLGAKLGTISQIISLQQQLLVGFGVQDVTTFDAMVDDALKMMGESAARHQVDIARHLGRTESMRLDASTMTQVLINLIKNAVEALDEVTDERRKVIEIASHTAELEGQQWNVLQVADNGPGMPDEVRKRAFELGFSTKPRTRGERGVGLHFCRSTVLRVGGRIDLVSTPGEGTRFTIWLQPHMPSPTGG